DWSSTAGWPTPDPAQCVRAGAPAAMITAPVTAAAVLVGWFSSAVAIGDGFLCLAERWGRAAVRFCFRCLADLLDTVRLRAGAIVALSDRPSRWPKRGFLGLEHHAHAGSAGLISAPQTPRGSADGNTGLRLSRTVGCRSPGCTSERLSRAQTRNIPVTTPT